MALTLSHDPGEWDGTFGVVVTRLIEDLLSDGLPIRATIVAEGGDQVFEKVLISALHPDDAIFFSYESDVAEPQPPVELKIPCIDSIVIV